MTIRAFHATNYGCLRDVHVALGARLHAFVGPNDSGKSTILRGIRAVLHFAHARFEREGHGPWKPFNPFPGAHARTAATSKSDQSSVLRCEVNDGSYSVEHRSEDDPTVQRMTHGSPSVTQGSFRSWQEWPSSPNFDLRDDEPPGNQLRGARLCQFDASALRSPSGLVPESDVLSFFDDRGLGLPGIYQALLGRDDDAFSKIRDAARALFPTLKRIAVVPITRSEVSLEVELTDGTRVRASEMSAGLLHYLAFAAIPYLDPVSAILIEEPENGLHPARIAEVIRLLRDFAERTNTQVFMATHSPLVLNELSPDEISVVTRPSLETGTLVTPLRSTPHFERRSKVYTPGELWLAYCDGDIEAPLLDEGVK